MSAIWRKPDRSCDESTQAPTQMSADSAEAFEVCPAASCARRGAIASPPTVEIATAGHRESRLTGVGPSLDLQQQVTVQHQVPELPLTRSSEGVVRYTPRVRVPVAKLIRSRY
jgi:hypothetical protein